MEPTLYWLPTHVYYKGVHKYFQCASLGNTAGFSLCWACSSQLRLPVSVYDAIFALTKHKDLIIRYSVFDNFIIGS